MSHPHHESAAALAGHTGASGTPVTWPDLQRQAAFESWLQAMSRQHGLIAASLRPASVDASFRRYFRVDQTPGLAGGVSSRIIMDAPPDLENNAAFVHVAKVFERTGLSVPTVLDWDQAHGFLLLSDLGTQTMMQQLVAEPADANQALFLRATDALLVLQKGSAEGQLPDYTRATMCAEMELFAQWYVQQHRAVTLDAKQRQTLDKTFATIAEQCLAWPQVYVHSDFMPRNLMVSAPDAPLGVLDFQDAVYGPITYDIASLMRDAFISWEEEFVLDITIRYWERARKAGLPVGDDFGAFYRGVEWMGLQRHMRIVGVFARLTLRDGKARYLADAPRFIGYIRSTAARYRELTPLLRLIDVIEGVAPVTGFAYGRV